MIFETERCFIKLIETDDKTDLLRMCDDSNVWQYLGGNGTAEYYRKNIEYIGKIDIGDRWVVRRKTDNLFLGYISLDSHYDVEDIQVTYIFLSEHWGKGYASEVVNTLIQYVFNEKKLNILLAETQSSNLASRRLLGKLGFYEVKNLVRFNAEQTLYAIEKDCGSSPQ